MSVAERVATERELFELYVARMQAECERLRFDILDETKVWRGRKTITQDDVWRGPWRNVRPWVTQEFIWWFEGHPERRMNFSEWQAWHREQERRNAEAEAEFEESGEDELRSLELMRDLLAQCDELIYRARAKGRTWAEVCEASGFSRAQANVRRDRHEHALLDSIEGVRL